MRLIEAVTNAQISWEFGIPYSCEFGDIFYSLDNGLDESRYVFVDGNNLIKRWQSLSAGQGGYFTIAETGFGTGLNFLLIWSLWEKYAPVDARLHFISCEKYPLTKEDLHRCISLWPELSAFYIKLLSIYPPLTQGFHDFSFANGRVNLTLMLGDCVDCYHQLLTCGDGHMEMNLPSVDAWCLDGFSPDKNPSMWSDELFGIIALLSNKNTSLSTFTAAGFVRRGLEFCGFSIAKIKGFGSKREMITARFIGPPKSLKKRLTAWHTSPQKKVEEKKAIVLGAGLAGCFMASKLAKRGWQVTLIDSNSEPGQGASGNRQAVIFPLISAHRSPLADFMLSSFLYATREYKELPLLGDLSGVIQIACNQKQRLAHKALQDYLTKYPDLGFIVDEVMASEIAGVKLTKSGLFVPMAGWFDSPALCQNLVDTPGVKWQGNTIVENIEFLNGNWHASNITAPVLVLANGCSVNKFIDVPMRSVRGQMTIVQSNSSSCKLRVPICGDGHLLPEKNGLHYCGATYDVDEVDGYCKVQDDVQNLAKIDALVPGLISNNDVSSSWAGVRAATSDYLPFVGPVADAKMFRDKFSALSSDSNKWVECFSPCQQGLYVCAGFGSRGATTIPLSTEYLSSVINSELPILPRAQIQAISPARFLRGRIIRGD